MPTYRPSELTVVVHRWGRAVDVALIAACVVIWLTERVVEASWPAMLASSPLVLALSTGHLPQLLLTAARLPAAAFAAAVTVHTSAATAAGYATGRRIGEPAVLRLLGRMGTERDATRTFAFVRRAGLPVVVVFPALSASLLVGAAETSAAPFAVAVVAAIVLRVVALSLLRHALAGSLVSVLSAITRWQWPLVGVSVAVVVVGALAQHRRRRADGMPTGPLADPPVGPDAGVGHIDAPADTGTAAD